LAPTLLRSSGPWLRVKRPWTTRSAWSGEKNQAKINVGVLKARDQLRIILAGGCVTQNMPELLKRLWLIEIDEFDGIILDLTRVKAWDCSLFGLLLSLVESMESPTALRVDCGGEIRRHLAYCLPELLPHAVISNRRRIAAS
jgi:anti-anti-sigma regulatory factor